MEEDDLDIRSLVDICNESCSAAIVGAAAKQLAVLAGNKSTAILFLQEGVCASSLPL
jgi:hypothetical protein